MTPEFAIIDYETVVGERGSTEFYRHDFRVASMAATWPTATGFESAYFVGEQAVRQFLTKCVDTGVRLSAHNIQFEMGVTMCRFPDLYPRINWYFDTMRLVQVYDNGGDKFAVEAPLSLDDMLDMELGIVEDDEQEPVSKKKKKPKPKSIAGLGLKAALKRVLRETLSHKDEAHEWLRANVDGCRVGNEGTFLSRLPDDLSRRYNVGDTEGAFRLFRFITERLHKVGYDWKFDHGLYLKSVRQIVGAKRVGVPVDRVRLNDYRKVVAKEIEEIELEFGRQFRNEIAAVERGRTLDAIRKLKTLRGRKNFLRRYRMGTESAVKAVRFNVGSNKQLAALFVDQIGITPVFRTNKGAPSFKSALLSQWGSGGDILKARRKRLLVFKQVEALLALTAYDGRWHHDLRACGTATGRYSGGQHT